MRRTLSQIIAAACLLLLGAFAAASVPEADLDGAWQRFMNTATASEPGMTFPHATCFNVAALEYGLPKTLLLAVARGESDFDVTARSRANAHGVMQIQWPGTARHLGIFRLSELYEPCTNIDAGARYLKELMDRYDGNLHLALAAYNYGPSRIRNDGTAIPSGANWYSGYIYRHLGYVLGDQDRSTEAQSTLYSSVGQSTLITFAEPYRAVAFVERLEARAPGVNLDWFRRGTGEFEVVMTYPDRESFNRSAKLLQSAGFPLD